MDRRRSSAAAAWVFEDFEPTVEWKLAGEEQDVVEISLPGFRKDQVRVQVDNHGVLRATGERPVRGGRWARFKKDLRLPDNCDADGVRARFEAEKLIITLPIVAPTTPSPPPPPSHSPTPSPSPPLPEKKGSKKTRRSDEPAGAESRRKVDETARGAKWPEKNNEAGALAAVGGAPTTATTMTPEPARQLMVNAAAAVAVLVGVIVAVWRTLQS